MSIKQLNNTAYEVEADNLLLAAQYPVLHRSVTIANPKAALKRGTAVINASGTLCVAGTKSGDDFAGGEIVGVLSADVAADAESETLELDAYVSGAFNVSKIATINDWDPSATAHVLGAQGNGIYLL